jgi:hypothetical protein
MSITRFDSFINNHAQKILVKLQEKKSIENLLFDFLNEYNSNILANIFESTTPEEDARKVWQAALARDGLSAFRPAAPAGAAAAPGAPRPAAPPGTAPGAPRPAAPPGTAPAAPRPAAPPGTASITAKKIIDDNKEKFKTILKATVTNKVFEMGTALAKHFADEQKAGMAQNYYVVLKNIKEKLIKFLDDKDTFNENTSHNSFKNFLENNSNKFELSKLSSAVLFDPKNTQEYLHEYILKNNIIKESTLTTANVNYGNTKYFGTKEIQKNNLQLIFKNITKSIKDKIIEIQGKIQDKRTDKNEKNTIEKYFTNIQDKIIKELSNNILPTIYTDMKPVVYKNGEAKTEWQKEQQQKRYEAIINHSKNLKRLFEFVKPRKEYALDKLNLKKPSLYDALKSVAHPADQGKDSINHIIKFILEDNILEVYDDHYRPYDISKGELEAVFCGIYGESKTTFEQFYKSHLISPYSQNKSESGGTGMIEKYASSRKLDTEDKRKLIFKYVRKGIEDGLLIDVKENYFSEKDLTYIFNMYVNMFNITRRNDVYYMDFENNVTTLLNYYREQKFNIKDTSFKGALDKKELDVDDWDNLEISDEEIYELDTMGANIDDLKTDVQAAAEEAQKLVKDGKVKLDEPLSKIKEMFDVKDNIPLHSDYLTQLALYRMCIEHKGLQELTEDDLKIILVQDFPKTDYNDHKRILTDEEVKSLPEIFKERGRYANFVYAYRYLASNNGNWKKMKSILEKK